jgi:ubiquinone/menaquinone biosynthesis C-methylase UbiE
MTLIPWRFKFFLSKNVPLLYHLAVNAGLRANSPEHWDARLAETWDDAGRHWPTKNALIASLTKRTDVILDVGCGDGHMLRTLRSDGYQSLHGLEISDYAVQRLRGEGIHMHKGKLPRIPLPDASFDVVIASQVLEHVIRRRFFIKEIKRVLKPGGLACIFVPDDCLGPIDEKEHVICYNSRSLRAFLANYFSSVQIESIRDVNHVAPILYARVAKEGSR